MWAAEYDLDAARAVMPGEFIGTRGAAGDHRQPDEIGIEIKRDVFDAFVVKRKRDVEFGRSQRCDYVVTDPNVSRRHFELQLRDAEWYLIDLNSTNGVSVNGRRVTSTRLSPGDEIVVGKSSFKFDVD